MARAFTISGRIEADASRLVAAAREGTAALAELGAAARAAGTASAELGQPNGAATDALEAQGEAGRVAVEWLGEAKTEVEAWGRGVVEASGRAVIAFDRQGEAGKGAIEIIAPAQRESIELGLRSVDAADATAAALDRQAEAGRRAVEGVRPAGAAQADLGQATDASAAALDRQSEAGRNTIEWVRPAEAAQTDLGKATDATTGALERQAEAANGSAGDGPGDFAGGARDAAEATDGWGERLMALARGPLPNVLAGIGLGIAAAKSYQESVAEIDIALVAHGDRIGLSGERYHYLSMEIGEAAGVSAREARSMTAAMISAGAESTQAMQIAGSAARGMAAVMGTDVRTATGVVARAFREPGAASRDWAEQLNHLNEAQLRNIESMERQGRRAEAQNAAIGALNDRIARAAAETSGWARAFTALKQEASDTWDVLGRFVNAGGLIAMTDPMQMAIALKGGRQNMGARVAGWLSPATADLERRAADSREVGELARRFDPQRFRLQELGDYETRLRGTIGDPKTDAATRADAEVALNGVLRERADILARLAKDGETAASRETARLAERAALQRQDLGLLEQIVDARLRGDDALARSLQGQRDAARAGFDLTSAAGREMAEMKARADQLADALKTIDEIEQRMAQLNPDVTPSANRYRLEFDLEGARRWRDEQLANLDAAKIGYSEFADHVQMIFGGMVASAYEDDLRRRVDWLAGVQRGLLDLDRRQRDFASTTERGLSDMADRLRLVRTGKLSLDDILAAFVDTLARMQWQQMVAPGFNELASGALKWGASLLGFGGGGGGGSSFKAWVPGLHDGGRFGLDAPTFTRAVSLEAWRDAPRYHVGGVFEPGEGPAILNRGEGVFTPRQMDSADQLITAIANRPIVINLDRDVGGMWGQGAGDRPPFEIHLHAENGSVRQERSQSGGGGERLDVFWAQAESYMAENLARGRGPLLAVLTQSFGAPRRPQ